MSRNRKAFSMKELLITLLCLLPIVILIASLSFKHADKIDDLSDTVFLPKEDGLNIAQCHDYTFIVNTTDQHHPIIDQAYENFLNENMPDISAQQASAFKYWLLNEVDPKKAGEILNQSDYSFTETAPLRTQFLGHLYLAAGHSINDELEEENCANLILRKAFGSQESENDNPQDAAN